MQSFQERVDRALDHIQTVIEGAWAPVVDEDADEGRGVSIERDYEDMNLNELADVVHENAIEKGFWEDYPHDPDAELAYIASKLALIHSEVSEALEDLRDPERGLEWFATREDGKPEGFASELADIIIRVLDLSESQDISIADFVAEKIGYNATRPALHGKAF
jgi:NTP pyrophosphatase (non-canonical NTP hydrolase)